MARLDDSTVVPALSSEDRRGRAASSLVDARRHLIAAMRDLDSSEGKESLRAHVGAGNAAAAVDDALTALARIEAPV